MLDSTWSTMVFEHEPHPRTGTMMLRTDEVLVETLEDNQVQLQNLMMSKYLSHFLNEVTSWQQKLSTADSVISIWFEVQRTWSHLESIFVGSEDIRTQLPEESHKFDDIDKEFKVRRPPRPARRCPAGASDAGGRGTLTPGGPCSSQALMEEAVKTPNVVEATNKPGLYEKLEDMKKRWVLACGDQGRPGRAQRARSWVRAPFPWELVLPGHAVPSRGSMDCGGEARLPPAQGAHGVRTQGMGAAGWEPRTRVSCCQSPDRVAWRRPAPRSPNLLPPAPPPPPGWPCAKRPWPSTWRRRDWLSRGSTLCPRLTSWTSSPTATTLWR